MTRNVWLALAVAVASVTAIGCSKPGTDSLEASFVQQLAANPYIKDFERNGDDLTFSGAGAEGGVAKWRVHIDSAVIEENSDPALPYKGTIKSSWYSDGQIVQPKGNQSFLPIELMANGLSQDCWAFWNRATERWDWE